MSSDRMEAVFNQLLRRPTVLAKEVTLRHTDDLLALVRDPDLDRPLLRLRGRNLGRREDLLHEACGCITLLKPAISVGGERQVELDGTSRRRA